MNFRMTLLRIVAAATFLLAMSNACPALAATGGRVTGTLRFYQNQGQFCDTAEEDCYGANYLDTEYGTYVPLRNVKVYLRRASDGVTLGAGVADANGNFDITWSSPENTSTTVARLVVPAEHKDGRFSIDEPGLGLGPYRFVKSGLTLVNGSTQLLYASWGSASSPNAIANVYDGAHRAWDMAIRYSSVMQQVFTGIDIVAFDPDPCPNTSCAFPGAKKIVMSSEAHAYSPQTRIMHEMGHIVSYLHMAGNSYKMAAVYFYPDRGEDGYWGYQGWGIAKPEWGAIQFEEAYATHLASVALYQRSAATPLVCTSTTACSSLFSNNGLETSLGTSCTEDQRRQPLQAMRYLWDTYDQNVDFTGENLSHPVSEQLLAMSYFDAGNGNRQKDEVWSGSAIDDEDGRSTVDFRANWMASRPSSPSTVDSANQLAGNCGGVGD